MSKYSEALNKLKENAEMFDEIAQENSHSYKDDPVVEAFIYHSNNLTVEQALIKAQEQEKALKIIYEKTVDIELLQKETITFKDYNEWIEFIYCNSLNNSEKERQLLTEEEFDLLKRC